MAFLMPPAFVNHCACSHCLSKAVQSRAGPIVHCDQHAAIARHSLPGSSGRCLAGDGEQQRWRFYVMVLRAGSRLSQKMSWFPTVWRLCWPAVKKFRPSFHSIKLVETVMEIPMPDAFVCTTPALSTVLLRLRVECCLHQVPLVDRDQHSARPDHSVRPDHTFRTLRVWRKTEDLKVLLYVYEAI